MRSIRVPSSTDLVDPQARLDSLIDVLDQIKGPERCNTFFTVSDLGDTFDLGVLHMEPGDHPSLALIGLTAADDWWAIGVQGRGRAHHLDPENPGGGRPKGPPTRMSTIQLLARTGEEAAILHLDGETHRRSEPAEGTIADLCRRVYGMPTPPPQYTTAPFWTRAWLHRVLAAWNRPEARNDLVASWSAIASLHPAFDDVAAELRTSGWEPDVVTAGRALAARFGWADLRKGARPLGLPGGQKQSPYDSMYPLGQLVTDNDDATYHMLPRGQMLPDDPGWFDDGSFARWVTGAFRPYTQVTGELELLLGEVHGQRLVNCVVALLES